jgi:hypothetical protein
LSNYFSGFIHQIVFSDSSTGSFIPLRHLSLSFRLNCEKSESSTSDIMPAKSESDKTDLNRIMQSNSIQSESDKTDLNSIMKAKPIQSDSDKTDLNSIMKAKLDISKLNKLEGT